MIFEAFSGSILCTLENTDLVASYDSIRTEKLRKRKGKNKEKVMREDEKKERVQIYGGRRVILLDKKGEVIMIMVKF